MIYRGRAHLFGLTGHELDNAVRQTGLDKDLVHEVVGPHRARARFPQADIAHQGRSARQIATNSGEVERRHCQAKAVEGTVLSTVPGARRVLGRLLVVDLLGILAVKAPEITQLGCSIDLCLPRVLALAEHRSRHNLVAVLLAQQVSCLEEDRNTVRERHRLPARLGCHGTIDSLNQEGKDVSPAAKTASHLTFWIREASAS